MNSYVVKTTNRIGLGKNDVNIVKANSIKEAIIKQMDHMKLENQNRINVAFEVTLRGVIE